MSQAESWKINMVSSLRKQTIFILGFTKRNFLMFYKDKAIFFFSLLAQFIIIFLYVLFLKDTYIDSIYSSIESISAITNSISRKDVVDLVNSWFVSGLVGTSFVTVCMNALSPMISDKEKKIDYDLLSSPTKNSNIILGYFLGAFLNTLLISTFFLTIGYIIVGCFGNIHTDALSVFISYVLCLFGSASSTLIMMIFVNFFKKISPFTAFSGIVSASIGFLCGAYMPMGSLGNFVQNFSSLLPAPHITGLFRNYLMNGNFNHIQTLLGNEGFVSSLKEMFSIDLLMFGQYVDTSVMYIYVSSWIVVSFFINVIIFKIKGKKTN